MGSEESGAGRKLDTADLEFERLNGELDAAIVFAAAANEAYQSRNYEFGATCLTDAKDCYKKVLEALPNCNLTGAQIHELAVKLMRLRHLLGYGTAPATNVAV